LGQPLTTVEQTFSTVATRLPDASPWNTTGGFMDPHYEDHSDRYGWPESENGERQLAVFTFADS